MLIIEKRVTLRQTMLQDGIPRRCCTLLPLGFREMLSTRRPGIEICPKIGWRISEQPGTHFGNLGTPLPKGFAPRAGKRVMFAVRYEFTRITVISKPAPTDERRRKLLPVTPLCEPSRPSPIEVKIAKELIGYVQAHTFGTVERSTCPRAALETPGSFTVFALEDPTFCISKRLNPSPASSPHLKTAGFICYHLP